MDVSNHFLLPPETPCVECPEVSVHNIFGQRLFSTAHVRFQAHLAEQYSSQMHMYCCLLHKRMQLTCTAWVQSVNPRDDCRGTRIHPVKNMSRCDCMAFHWPPFVRCFVHNKPKVKSVPSSKHREHY